jgi:hypothetical protein
MKEKMSSWSAYCSPLNQVSSQTKGQKTDKSQIEGHNSERDRNQIEGQNSQRD